MKAGAFTPATPVAKYVAGLDHARSMKAGAFTPATLELGPQTRGCPEVAQ